MEMYWDSMEQGVNNLTSDIWTNKGSTDVIGILLHII